MKRLLLLTLAIAATSNAAVQYNGQNYVGRGTSTGFTKAGVVVSGTNPVLVVNIGMDSSSATVSSVTWSLGSGTSAEAISIVSGTASSKIWCIANPTAGTGSVVATFSGSVPWQYELALYSGADPTNPCPSGNATSSNSVGATTTLTPTSLGSGDATVANCVATIAGSVTSVTPHLLFIDSTTTVHFGSGYATGTSGVTCNFDDSTNTKALTAVRVQVPGTATLTSIAVTPANPTVVIPATQQFTATGTYSDSSTQNLTSQATWASSDQTKATISTGGLATSVAAGTTTISATLGAIVGNTLLTVSETHFVSLSWSDTVNSGATYNVYRAQNWCLNQLPITSPLVTGLTTMAYTDTTISTGIAYCYYVTAVLGGLESVPSNTAQAAVGLPGSPGGMQGVAQ